MQSIWNRRKDYSLFQCLCKQSFLEKHKIFASEQKSIETSFSSSAHIFVPQNNVLSDKCSF